MSTIDDVILRVNYEAACNLVCGLGVDLADEILNSNGVFTPKAVEIAQRLKDAQRIREAAHRRLIMEVAG